ncbi:MAG: ATP-binding protein [Thermodesulfobacteriota bacterium]
MRITVASGKGGTGKTMVAASLARVWDAPVTAVDLDVEEPNLHLFLHPALTGGETAVLEIPVAEESLCSHCRACAELCQFKAITVLGDVLLTFPEMCHGCGGCLAVCPDQALRPGTRELGRVVWGSAGRINFIMGRLRVGEAMSPPLIRAVKQKLEVLRLSLNRDVILDAPPGVSCPAVNAVMDADAVVLVTEPTPFGLHDLKLAVEAFSPLDLPLGLVINRGGVGDRAVYEYAASADLPILTEIPYDRRIAEAYSQGRIVAEACPEYQTVFVDLMGRIRSLARPETGARRVA